MNISNEQEDTMVKMNFSIETQEPLLLKPKSTNNGLLSKGSVNSAAINLLMACMGAGTVTMPYIVTRIGILPAFALIIFGAALAHYCSMLLVKCCGNLASGSSLTDALPPRECASYEDFAEKAWGKRWRKVTAVTNILCLLGIAATYISFAKSLIPTLLHGQTNDVSL